jgi:hypothetical protein
MNEISMITNNINNNKVLKTKRNDNINDKSLNQSDDDSELIFINEIKNNSNNNNNNVRLCFKSSILLFSTN